MSVLIAMPLGVFDLSVKNKLIIRVSELVFGAVEAGVSHIDVCMVLWFAKYLSARDLKVPLRYMGKMSTRNLHSSLCHRMLPTPPPRRGSRALMRQGGKC